MLNITKSDTLHSVDSKIPANVMQQYFEDVASRKAQTENHSSVNIHTIMKYSNVNIQASMDFMDVKEAINSESVIEIVDPTDDDFEDVASRKAQTENTEEVSNAMKSLEEEDEDGWEKSEIKEIQTIINAVVVMETKESHHDLEDPQSQFKLPIENSVRNVSNCYSTRKQFIVVYPLIAFAFKLFIIRIIVKSTVPSPKHILVLSVGAFCQFTSALLNLCDWWKCSNNKSIMIFSWVFNTIAFICILYFTYIMTKDPKEEYSKLELDYMYINGTEPVVIKKTIGKIRSEVALLCDALIGLVCVVLGLMDLNV